MSSGVRAWAVIVVAVAIATPSAGETNSERDRFAVSVSDKIAIDPGLLRAINNYYRAERAHLWADSYAYRPREFRETVSSDFYSAQMEKHTRGWQLKKATIDKLSISSEGDVSLSMTFLEAFDERVASERFDGKTASGVQTTDGVARWRADGQKWICVGAATRGHIPLESFVVH